MDLSREALAQNFKDKDFLPELRMEIGRQLVKSENLLVEFEQQPQDWKNMLQGLAHNLKPGTASRCRGRW